MENTKKTIEDVRNYISILTDEQQQLLKDTIKYGEWGDGEERFSNEDGTTDSYPMIAYCTNDASMGGHFSGRKLSAMFCSMYKTLCPNFKNTVGDVISHCSDWWDDGSGDMLFIREEWTDAFTIWARN